MAPGGQFYGPPPRDGPGHRVVNRLLNGHVVGGWAQRRNRRIAMQETRTATDTVGEREGPDKSPQAVEEAVAEAKAGDGRKPGQRAELANLEIVRHYFDLAADRLKLADDLR